MNCIEAFLGRYYSLGETTKKQRRDLTVETIRYIYRLINVQEYNRRINKIFGTVMRTKEQRQDILKDGYIMKNVKLWLYYVMANDLLRKQRVAIAESFEINADDIELLSLAKDLEKDFKRLIKDKYSALTLEKFESRLSNQLTSVKLKVLLEKFVFKKMKFIVQTQGLEGKDLIQELYAEGAKTAFYYYPKIKSFKHFDHIITRAAVNYGKNMLGFYSGKKRSKLIATEEGHFTNKIVPISFAVTDEQCIEFLSSSLSNTEKDYDQTLSVRRILSQYDGKRKQFLDLLMHYDAKFTQWLADNRITRMDNDEYFDRVDSSVYIRHVLNYLGVKQHYGAEFIDALKKKLAA